MLQMLVVTLREGIEMFLIVAIAAAYLVRTGRNQMLPAVWSGTAAAVGASIVLGVWLAEVAVVPIWEGALATVAAILVVSMVVYMLKMARHLRGEIGRRIEAAAARTGTAAWLGVFLFVVLMITREGMETAFIIAALVRTQGSSAMVGGALVGIALAAGLGLAWVRYGHRLNLGLFFQVTSVFLVLFALQLLLYAFHEFTEANVLPIDNAYWHVATEEWAEGRYAQLISLGLVFAPVAWLVLASLRGRPRTAAR